LVIAAVLLRQIAWVNNKFPKPNHLKILLSEIKEMQEDIRKLREDIENFVVKRDVGVARIASLQKELTQYNFTGRFFYFIKG
jgi:peptidoglycan hydrolase CwlO-like protein